MKHIIAMWHSAGKGKSETIRQLANQFLLRYSTTPVLPPTTTVVPTAGDFRLIIDVALRGTMTRLAFESQGDPGTNLESRLENLAVHYNCDIIFCTCRTRGETVIAIENTADNFDYNIIWSSTYQVIGSTNQIIANQQKATHIIQLLQELSII